MSKLTQTGQLPLGVEVDGTVHRDFELRAPTVEDNIVGIDEVGMANPVALSAALFARQLVKLGTLTRAQIDTALIRTMHPKDFDALERAAMDLEKKLLGGAQTSSGGPTAASPLPDTASPSTTH